MPVVHEAKSTLRTVGSNQGHRYKDEEHTESCDLVGVITNCHDLGLTAWREEIQPRDILSHSVYGLHLLLPEWTSVFHVRQHRGA